MQGAMSRGGSSDLDARVQSEESQHLVDETGVLSELTQDESVVLEALSASPAGATMGRLRSGCDLSEERLASGLDGLRRKGLVVQLNTVVESYSCRFPGLRVT